MADITDLQGQAKASRATRDAARGDLRQRARRLTEIERELADARRARTHRGQDIRVAALEREQGALNDGLDDGRRDLAAGREALQTTLQPFFRDPQNLVSQLPDTTPFILFPVRLETKFMRGENGPVLRVRIFPDDIAVAHHEKALTVSEKEAGQSYWRSRALANAAPVAEKSETLKRGAWNLVAARYGPYRASWITRSTRPDAWSDVLVDPNALVFPIVDTKPLGWSDAPRSPVMPDLFAVLLERGAASRTVFGKVIPDDLPLGPDPLQAEGFLTRDPMTHRLSISDDLRWMIDFTRAEAVGMGIEIALTDEEAVGGFDRILALGLRLSTDRDESAALLTQLIESHRYSHGCALVPQGSPTNNTDEVGSGLTTVSESVDETYTLEHDPTPFPSSIDPMRQLDGERLAFALGLPLDAVRALPNARQTDIAESVAMNRALWSATLGHFLSELLKGTFPPADIARLERFLVEFVHGRGLAPAIRVGPQPYGIVITSAFDQWIWSDDELGDEGDFWVRLQTQIRFLRAHWQQVANDDVRFVGKRDKTGQLLDPFKTLINIIGLQASSVEYWSRTGVPDSYLSALAAYRGNDPDLVKNWIANAKNTRILELTNAHLPHSDQARLGSVLFLDSPDRVSSPVVDGDPSIPLSERRPIRPYDGVAGHNYISWLITASSAALQSEQFVGADGKLTNPPNALLYKMLRVATLCEVNASSRSLAERIRADVFATAPSSVGDMPNVAEPVMMPAHYAMIDTAKIALTPARSLTTGDYLLEHARAATALVEKPPEAAALADLTDALRVLADLPTARLERLFAEHVDVVSSRLDAWLTGMFGRRLAIHRRSRRHAQGSYLGAYGWLLDIRPTTDREIVPPAQIPPDLMPAVDGPVVTYSHNGGFVHAPSLPHAVTAAVLRNAYLTHAEEKGADRMSINLSSARVRTALDYIEGLQNGQELGALLGYQLERGLHEGHPGVELDQFIYVLRERFPLISKKLTPTPAGTPSEVLEARNVINGYDLIDFVKGQKYPYGIAGLPSESGSAASIDQAKAIAAEVDRLQDALDAVADLLLAESVHQVVQGNYARARGSVQALTDGERPPLPEVVQTPRSGKSLTHRIALFLDPAATSGWHAALSPRGGANAPLNHWLATVLPSAGDIQWQITLGTAVPEFLDVATLGIEPLDLVLMSGERAGDLTSKLEQLIIRDFRAARGIADDVATFTFTKTDPTIPDAKALIFDPDRARPGKYSLGSLLPLLKALRRIIASRPLHARDLMRPTEAQHAHPENPNGYNGAVPPLKDLADLKSRIEAAFTALDTHNALLQPLVVSMRPLAAALDQDATLPIQPAWVGLVAQTRVELRAILLFGIPEALPPDTVTLSRPLVAAVFAQASAVVAIVKRKLTTARELLDRAFPNPLPPDPADAAREIGARVTARFTAYSDAAQLLLGPDFVAVPLFAAHPEGVSELTLATTSPVETNPLTIESWQQSLAHVRPAMAAWNMVATYNDWVHDAPLPLVPLQLPVQPGAKWIGAVFGQTVAADDVISIAMHHPPTSFTSPLAGVCLDEWTELVPTPNETTGLAMHINRPNAVAPQALLVAVAPRRSGTWDWSDLVAILHDTMDRARLRAVEPDGIKYPYFQLLPPIVTSFNNTPLMATAKFASAVSSVPKISKDR